MITAFVSYSYKDRELARDVKDCLDYYGVRCFLAHDDLKPSVEWASVIRTELQECDVFLPLLTLNFRQSKWTDQETGIALALNKLAVPLNVDLVPYGFLGAIQAVRLNANSPSTACQRIVSAFIENRPESHSKFLDGFIPTFADSTSYDEAGKKAAILMQCDGYSTEQVQQVLEAIIDNRQIYQSGRAHEYLPRFIRIYGKAHPGLSRKAKRAIT